MKKNNENSKQKIYDSIMFSQAGTANDCTGLIPKGIEDKEEYRSYEDIRNFAVPKIVKENID
ncbi:MAG: hypothetical protein IJX24_06305 [Oscillospiraceae bacterium]|nr:hypothetical protein [Oscillospiraceae bacterium]